MARVIIPFRDRKTWVAYAAGDFYDGTPERISELVAGGYVQSGPVAHNADETAPESPSVDDGGNLDGLTVAELRALAKSRGVDVPKRSTKPQLLAALGVRP